MAAPRSVSGVDEHRAISRKHAKARCSSVPRTGSLGVDGSEAVVPRPWTKISSPVCVDRNRFFLCRSLSKHNFFGCGNKLRSNTNASWLSNSSTVKERLTVMNLLRGSGVLVLNRFKPGIALLLETHGVDVETPGSEDDNGRAERAERSGVLEEEDTEGAIGN